MRIPARDFFFPPFRFDAESGRLWNGVRELPIRSKTAAVLRHLTEHAGRIVPVAELVHVVWADSSGSTPLVKGCVREVRRLLGDERATPRYLETVGRRGYRFMAPIHDQSASAMAWASDDRGAHFVGRGSELQRLDARLEAALAGRRQMVFLSGEPGIGKTTLACRFLAAATDRHELRIGRGQCVERYGPGEPYHPFLQALAALCRAAGGERVVEVLGCYAPTWLRQMPSLLPAAERARPAAPSAGSDRARMVREMCDAAVALAAARPLVLWLDDLQWSDPSTVDLIAALALGGEPARLLVLGTYRPAEVVVSRHPFGPTRKHLATSGRACELAIGALSGADVQRHLTLRFPANDLPSALGTALLEITDGNPLFLSSLLDDLVAQGLLADEAGCWRLRGPLADLGDTFPESARHLIERQVERLTDADQRILEAGSTAGREFAAGSIAAALGLDADVVDERLQGLASVAQLVEGRGLDSPPHRPTSGRYGFVHAVHQRVLYGRVSPAHRAHLHRRLGAAQEAAWGDRSDEIAAELALHFERGGEAPRAIRFLRAAAETSAQRLASTEAIAHLTQAVGLVEKLGRRDRALEEVRLQMALGLMLMNAGGQTASEVDRACRRAADLLARIDNRPALHRTLRAVHRVTLIRGDVGRALTLARKGVAVARKAGEAEKLLEAHLALGVSLFYAGDMQPARAALLRCLRLRGAVSPSSSVFRMLDPAIVVHAHLGFLAWLCGAEAEMREHLAEMRHQANVLGQRLSRGYAHIAAMLLHQFARDVEAVGADAEAVLATSAEHGFALFVALARCCRGWGLAVGQRHADGLEEIRTAIADWRATGARFLVPYQLGMLGEAQAALGIRAAALVTFDEALAVAKETGEHWWQPELLRLAGETRGRIADRARGTRRAEGRRVALAGVRRAMALARDNGASALVQRSRETLGRLQ